MDIQRFVEQYSQFAQDWTRLSGCLASPQFEALRKQTGETPPAAMSLLNLAVGCMAAGEVYCEVGCLQGTTLIAALLDHPDCMAYAVEDADRLPYEAVDQLSENLVAFGLDEQVYFCCQPFEAFFHDFKESALDDRIGVYFYNGSVDYRSLILGLMLAAPLLADQALIVVAQAQSKFVRQATGDFAAAYPQAKLLTDFATDGAHSMAAANLLVLSWDAVNVSANAPFDWQQYRDRSVIDAIYNLPATSQIPDLQRLRQEAVQLHVEGQFVEAEQKYQTILKSDPQNAEIWLNLGMLYYLTENDAAAIESLHQSLSINSNNALTHHILGLALERKEQLSEACAAYQQAIALDPNYADALNRLGKLYVRTSELDQAKALFQQAIAASPDDFAGYLNLGDVLISQHQHRLAVDAYKHALSRQKRDPDILQKIGAAYREIGDLAAAHNYFAYAFYRLSDHAAAIEEFQQYFQLQPTGTIKDYLVLYDCYHNCGQTDRAIECIQIVSQLQPEDRFLDLCSQLILPAIYQTKEEIDYYRQRVIQGFKTLDDRVKAAVEKSEPINITGVHYFTNFYLSYQGYNDRDLQAIYGQLLHRLMIERYPKWVVPKPMPPLSKTGKIRIGYLADSIGNSSATRWALGWLKHHDRSRFEIYCYNIGVNSDRRTEQFKTLCDVFHHIPDDIEAISEQIIADDLHILVFLAIGTWAATAQLASLRLAPVQCSAWGHPVTSGLAAVDYFLSGDLMEPDNAQDHYTEQLVRLPNIGISYPKPLMAAPIHTRADFGLRDDAIIYLSCQLIFKYLPQHDYLFPEIIQRVPQAQLVFVLRSAMTHRSNVHLEEQFRQRLQRAFAAAGLNIDDHCVFLPGQDWDRYTSLLSIADAFLDTLSFSGGHTTFDAIARSLPVVTYPGELMRGRQSYGALKMLGVTETIAQTEAEYIEIAARLGLEPEWKRAIAQQMSERQQYLFDDYNCVVGLEQFYQQVVAAKLAPQSTLPLPAAQIKPNATKFVLHVGCGPYDPETLPEPLLTEEWQEVRLDINPDVQPDIIGSMTDMSAVPSGSVDAVFSSHNLEHLYAHEVPIALAEFYRVLKPNGFVLITLPDIQKVAEYVAQGKLEEPLCTSLVGPITALDVLYGLGTEIADGNYFMAHRTAFTAKTLHQKLEAASFSNIEIHKDDLNLWARGYKDSDFHSY